MELGSVKLRNTQASAGAGDVERGYANAAHGGELFQSNTALQEENQETRLLRLAGTLLARSHALESRISAIEGASQNCKCAQVVSQTIVDVLEQAKVVLSKMRDLPDSSSKSILAKSYDGLLEQIDFIVLEGYYDGKNLAKNDNIIVAIDGSRHRGFSIDGIDMGSAGLGLTAFKDVRISNTEVIERLTKVEMAANNLTAHSYSYNTISVLLKTRMKFARGMIDILDEGGKQINSSRAGQDAVSLILSQICGSVSDDKAAATGQTYTRSNTSAERAAQYTGSPVGSGN